MKKFLQSAAVLLVLASRTSSAQCSATITPLGLPTGCGNRTLTASPIGDQWTQKASMSINRINAAGFSIGNKGYIGTGGTPSNSYTNDFWEYDATTNTWTQKANFPGSARQAAVGFSIGSKGYMGTGVDLNNLRRNDFYEYDPLTNTWLQRANITGSRSFAVGFSIGAKGYVGTGYVSTAYVNDFYEYDPVTNAWTQRANFGGTGRHSATGFSIGTKGYIGFGSTGTAGTNDFWEYDPGNNLWTQKASIYNLQMLGACGFGLGNKGYVACGKDQGTTNLYSSKTYQFDPATNTWKQLAPNGANAKYYSVAFTIGGKGYVATGGNTNVLFEYEPPANYAWSTGATTQSISVGGTASYSVLITTATGCTASASQTIATAANPTLSVSGGSLVCAGTNNILTAGGASSYTWSANAGGGGNAQTIVTPTSSTTYTVSGTTGSCTVSFPVSVFVSGPPLGNISVSGSTLGCGSRTLSVNPGGDAWTQRASMSLAHSRPFAFSIGSKAYLGTGAGFTNGNGLSKDFWEYDPVTNAWTQKADFGGGQRYGSFAFSIGNKAYVGSGFSDNTIYGFEIDLWEYDPVMNAWARKRDIPMTPRELAVTFTIGNKGYVGTGHNDLFANEFSDFWEYDPATDTWLQKANVPAPARYSASAFSIGNKGYLGTGYTGYPSSVMLNDFWEFDPVANTWTAKAAYGGGTGAYGAGFSLGNKGFICGSFFSGSSTSSLWEYDPSANTWVARANFPGLPRTWSVGFTVGNKAYVGAGYSSYSPLFMNDLWQYDPTASTLWNTGATTASISAPGSGTYSVSMSTFGGCTVTAAQTLSLSPNPTVSVSGNSNNLCAGLNATLAASGAGSYTWSSNAGGGNSASVIVSPAAPTVYTVSGTTGTCTVSYPVAVNVLPVPSASIAASGPTLGCGTVTLSVNAPPGGWTQKANLSVTRREGISFSIGSKGYVGLGQNMTQTLNDLWEYDPQTNTWTQKASFTPGARYDATGFSIGAKGYVAGGFDNSSYKSDLWEFDPAANTWTQRASMNAARSLAVGFGLNGKGYVGLGSNTLGIALSDFWEYDPATDTWTQRAYFGGVARTSAAAFTIGIKGYVGTGVNNSGSLLSDFWEYDPAADAWTAKAAYGGGAVYGSASFALGNTGYFVAGKAYSAPTNSVWAYDAVLNTWTQQPDFSGSARESAASFAIGGKGYVGVGFALNSLPVYPGDLWEFEPGSTALWSNSSSAQAIAVTGSGSYSVTITNAYGCSATSSQSVSLSPNPTITVSGVPAILCAGISSTLAAGGAGSYTWSANAGGLSTNSVVVSPTLSTSYTVSGTTGSCTVDYPVNVNVSALPVATIAASGPTLGCGSLNLSVNTPSSNWTQKAGFTAGRTNGVAFSVGNKGYVGLGANAGNLVDIWEYDPVSNAWTQKANFGGGVRLNPAAFSIGNKGYVAAGFVPSGSQYKNDFWEFDPAANTWVQKASLPGAGRRYCTGFALSGKGYIGLGTNSTGSGMNDLWEYDLSVDSWIQKANFSGGARTKAAAFTIGSLAYVGTGMSNTSYITDLWAFDPVANTWTAKANYSGTPVQLASGFSLGNKGYIGLGYTGVNELNAFWEYNAVTNTWTQRGNFAGTPRQSAVTFAIGNKAYVATGYNTLNAPYYMNDLWEYQEITAISWSTGSTLQAIPVSVSGNYSVTLTNTDGCAASSSQSVALSPNPTISVSGSAGALCSGSTGTLTASGAGSYSWSANAGGSTVASVTIMPAAPTIYTVSGTTGSCTVSYPIYVDVITSPVAGIITVGSATVCGAAITLSTNAGASNVWTQKTSISTARSYAAGFSVNGKGYVGTGLSGSNSLSDFWEYDPAANTWTQKANFGGGARYAAVGMSIGNKGYIGTGFDGTAGLNRNDFWEYDPVANTWTQKANFGGAVRRQAAGFTIGNKGYLGTGWDGASFKNDLWEYNPATNVWAQKANIASHRYSAAGTGLGNKGYLAGGQLLSGGGTNEFWEYDPAVNSWTQRANIGGATSRSGAVAFAIGSSLIVSGGTTSNDAWEYNPASDTWTARPNFAGPYRSNAAAFAVNGKGYIASGSGTSTYSDLWEYSPVTGILWSTGAVTPSISASSSGTYSVTLSTAGCVNSSTQAVSIQPVPTVNISGPNAICNGSSLTFTVSGADSYTWSSNAGNATTSLVTVSPASNTSYVVTGATNGCTVSATKNVTVTAIPVVTANSSTTSVCQGFSISLNGGGATTYTWTGGITDNTPFIPQATSDYTVTGATNNCTNTAVVSVTVKPSPTVTVNSGTICEGQSFTINPAGAISYTYSGGNNVVAPSVTTSYSVTGINAIGCTNAIPAISAVTVDPLPIITVNSGVVCAGDSYTISPTGAASYTYSSGANVISPVNTMTYGISGTSTAGCVSANETVITVTVNPLPLVSVSGGTVCNGHSFTLAPSGATHYTYVPGGSAIVSPTANTTYSVRGADAFGCLSAAMATAAIQVLVSPTVSVNSGSVCAGESFTLVPGGAVTYIFSGGSDIVSPGATTVYSVTGINATGCSNVVPATATVTVHALPVISANSGTLCAGESYTISPSGATSYTYSGGTNIVSPAVTSTYAISGSNSDGCISSAPAIITITVNPLPLVSVSSGSICSGNSFDLNPSGATAYTIIPGGSSLVSPNATTSYSVTGASAFGCLSALPAISSVTVHASPLLSVNSGSICAGASFTLIPSGAVSYTYSGGSAIVSPNTTTAYSVTGTGANGCLSATPAIANVTVHALPVITAGSGTVCSGKSFTISPTGASSYTYSSGSNVVTPATVSSYTVSGTSAEGCPGNTVLVTVSVQPALTLSISGTSTVCEGKSVVLTASGASTYTWNTGANTASVSANPLSGTGYTVNATGGVCTASATKTISMIPVPPLQIQKSHPLLCVGETATITVAGADQYAWSDGSTLPMIVISPTVTTSYTLTGVNLSGCNSSSVITQQVSSCAGMALNATLHTGIVVYPNPNKGSVTISAAAFPEHAILELYNYLGQLISSQPISGTEAQLRFEQADNGMYTIRISVNGKSVFVSKLIKQ